MNDDILYVIPARKGSKGIKGKNKKLLGGKPLISYTIETAQKVVSKDHICVSTDDEGILAIASQSGLETPFIRPDSLAQDDSSSREVLLHAIGEYEKKGVMYSWVCMLQPTSPFRTANDIVNARKLLIDQEIDAVLSVFKTKSNPYYILMEEDSNGYLNKSKEGFFQRRQDCPDVYELNGAIYFLKVSSLKDREITQMERIIKYEMSEENSIDIDTPLDFEIAECLIQKKSFEGLV